MQLLIIIIPGMPYELDHIIWRVSLKFYNKKNLKKKKKRLILPIFLSIRSKFCSQKLSNGSQLKGSLAFVGSSFKGLYK